MLQWQPLVLTELCNFAVFLFVLPTHGHPDCPCRRIVEGEDMPPTGQRQTMLFSATFPKVCDRPVAQPSMLLW